MNLAGFLVMVLIWMFIAGDSRKKQQKKKGQATPARPAPSGNRRAAKGTARSLFEETRTQPAEGAQGNPDAQVSLFEEIKASPVEGEGSGEGADPCHEDMLGAARPSAVHFHPVEETEMAHAAEGEDPCHPVSGVRAQAPDDEETEDEERLQAMRRELLRGVIMREVLTRPCERRAARRR